MDDLLTWIKHDSWMTRISSFFLRAMLAFLPAIPIPLVAGIIATTYSVPVALFISLGGSVFGSICMFFLCRYAFQRKALNQVQNGNGLMDFFNYSSAMAL